MQQAHSSPEVIRLIVMMYVSSLEWHVPDDHLLRKIDRFIDLSEVRAHLGPYYSDVGRPRSIPS
jgi:hypothetical protein